MKSQLDMPSSILSQHALHTSPSRETAPTHRGQLRVSEHQKDLVCRGINRWVVLLALPSYHTQFDSWNGSDPPVQCSSMPVLGWRSIPIASDREQTLLRRTHFVQVARLHELQGLLRIIDGLYIANTGRALGCSWDSWVLLTHKLFG